MFLRLAMKVKEILFVFLIFGSGILFAQEIKIPAVISNKHPRFLPGNQKQDFFKKLIAGEEWAAKIYSDTKTSKNM